MASFNPDSGIQETQIRDQTGASRGTGVDRTFEILFKGLGDTISGAANVVDTSIQNRIDKDARHGFDGLNDEFGVSSDVVPGEITQSAEGLEKLAAAQAQGKIPQEYYYQRLAATLKGLRAKYPGYEKEVDTIVQNVTGVRPANAFRDALWSAVDAQNRASASSSDKFQTYVNQNDDVVSIVAPDYFQNPEKYSTPEAQLDLRRKVGEYKGRKTIAENTAAIMSADQKIAGPQIDKLFQNTANAFIAGSASAIGIGGPPGSSSGTIQDQFAAAYADNKITPEERASLTGYINQAKAALEQNLRQQISTNDWSVGKDASFLDERVKLALAPLDRMAALVQDDNVNAAKIIAERATYMQDQNKFEIMQKFPELQTIQTLRGISEPAADAATGEFIQKNFNNSGMSFVDAAMGKDLAQGVLDGKISLSQLTERMVSVDSMGDKEKGQIINSVLEASTAYLADPSATPETKKTVVTSVYGDKLDQTWKNVSDETTSNGQSQRMRLFAKMFSPEVTKQISQMNDPEALEQYAAAAADKFQQIPEFRRAAADTQNMQEWNRYAKVDYDPERNRLVVSVDRAATGAAGLFTRGSQQRNQKDLVSAVDSFNRAVSYMAPIIEASGVDEIEGIKTLTQQMAVSLEGGEQKGMWSWLWDRLDTLNSEDLGKAMSGEAPSQKPSGDWQEIGSDDVSVDDDEISWNHEGDSVPALGYAASADTSSPFDTVLRAGKGWTEIKKPDGTKVRRSGARNWRNNNPGNIEYGKFAKSSGAVGTDGRFAVFPTYQAGRAAKEKLLFETPGYRNKTISGAINRYAPPFENDTSAYANAVARAVGVPVDTPVSDLTDSQRQRMLDAMERVEGFKVGREVALQ